MGRNPIDISKEELREALKIYPTQQMVADHFGCSQATISNKIVEHELSPVVRPRTLRDSKIEFPSLSWDKSKEILLKVQEENSPTVGYEKVEIEIESAGNLLIVPVMDLHIGSRYTYSKEFILFGQQSISDHNSKG